MENSFTLSMLAYQMEKQIPCGKYLPKGVNETLNTWKFYRGGQAEDGCLYFLDQEQMAGQTVYLNGHCICCVNGGPDLQFFPNVGKLRMECESLLEAANLLQDAFNGYKKWKKEIQDILDQTSNISEILTICGNYLQMDLCLVDDDYAILGARHGSRFWDTSEAGGRSAYLSLDLINELIQEEEYANVKKYNDVFPYTGHEPADGRWNFSLCYNIKIRGSYFGRLVAYADSKRERTGAIQFVRYLGKFFTNYYEKESVNQIQGVKRQAFYQSMLKLLKGESLDSDLLDHILKYKDWNKNQPYQVVKFQFLGHVSFKYYCAQIEQIFTDSIALSLGDAIYCIQNLTGLSGSHHKLPLKFAIFLRESLCRAGISNEAADITEVAWCKKEADIALEIGQVEHKEFWYHYFSDYTLRYMARQAVGGLNTERVCDPAIRTLRKYDEKNGTELVLTLKSYLSCQCNSTHAAQDLYIHRTTLIHRIAKIKELTGISFTDASKRLHLLLSFYLIE